MADVMPGHDLEGDAGGAQRGGLLAASCEDERVAALEAHDGAAGVAAAVLDEEGVDLVLGRARTPGALPTEIRSAVAGARSSSDATDSRS